MPVRTAFIVYFLFASFSLYAGEYDIRTLPDSLKKNANAIVWKSEQDIVMNKDLSFVEKVHRVITILNEKGIEEAVYLGYDSRDMSTRLIKGIIYDENGNAFKKLKKQDLNTIAEYSSFISDFKADYYDPEIHKFPFTAEYEYETKFNYLLYIPDFDPYRDYNISVLDATYKLEVPGDCGIRWYPHNCAWRPATDSKDDGKIYTFAIRNGTPVLREDAAPDFNKAGPRILIAPDRISYYGYKGSFQSWTDFGEWINQLYKGRDSLPAELKEKMHQYSQQIPDRLERAKAIYKWVQDNTRYYSIQLGLGGFQPMTALEVDQKKYGDCKALALYTGALLRAAGIDAYCALVKAGKNEQVVSAMPSQQFNHVILCMPSKEDTIWLECTDQKIPFGYLGDFTDDRDVLLIGDHPAIVHTRSYTSKENQRSIVAKVHLGNEKQIQGEFNYTVKGLSFEKLYKVDYLPSRELRDKYLYELLNVNDLRLDDYSISSRDSVIPQKTLSAHFEVSNYINTAGSKTILRPNIFSRYHKIVQSDSIRTLPIEQTENYTEEDSIYFTLPAGLSYPDIQPPVKLETRFGRYEVQLVYNKEEQLLLYIRKLTIHKGIFPPEDLNAYVDFVNKIASYDRSPVLLGTATH